MNKGSSSSSNVNFKTSCEVAQGLLKSLPACVTDDELLNTVNPSRNAGEVVLNKTVLSTATESVSAPEETGVERKD